MQRIVRIGASYSAASSAAAWVGSLLTLVFLAMLGPYQAAFAVEDSTSRKVVAPAETDSSGADRPLSEPPPTKDAPQAPETQQVRVPPTVGDPTVAEPLNAERDVPPILEEGVERFVEPRETHPGGTWYLGVFGHYTNTGHLLTQVVPNTPASRAGLEAGDRLITVNGRQIGQVLGQQYSLDFLLQRYASPSGYVRLLVQDRRTNRLVNLDIRLKRVHIHY